MCFSGPSAHTDFNEPTGSSGAGELYGLLVMQCPSFTDRKVGYYFATERRINGTIARTYQSHHTWAPPDHILMGHCQGEKGKTEEIVGRDTLTGGMRMAPLLSALPEYCEMNVSRTSGFAGMLESLSTAAFLV